MQFRIADTFTESLAKLTGQEQKGVKTTAFDLQLNPANPGIQFHRLDRARDPNFWSLRVTRDIRIIVHKTSDNLLLCYLSRLYEVQKLEDRTPYDYVVIDNDSSIERGIAEQLDSHERVKFFCKLPDWFKVPTPVGNYNPDWAIVKEDDAKLYLVKETKSSHTRHELRGNEAPKFDCGKKHFEALGVDFGVATNIHEVLEKE